MIVVVSGSRRWKWIPPVRKRIRHLYEFIGDDLLIRNGMCPSGLDDIVYRLCGEYEIGMDPFPADWRMGRQAGLERNTEMLDVLPRPDLVLVWRVNKSPGASDMIRKAQDRELPLEVRGIVL